MANDGNGQFSEVGNGLRVLAPAKINLSLLVGPKRADGFHEIETVMAKVDWYDELLIEKGQGGGIELICQGEYWAPEGEGNLVYRACRMLLDDCGVSSDLKITLTKNIPAGTGLGSASSDAAACLMGVEKFLDLGVSGEKLSEMAGLLGSDVGFFLGGPLAFCSGKGEKVKEIEEKFDFLALLILSDVSISTKTVYAGYDYNADVFQGLKRKINGYIAKNTIDLIPQVCANMLEVSCFSLNEKLAELKIKIESLGVGPVCLSGSGSCMYVTVEGRDEKLAREYQGSIRDKIGCKSIIVGNNGW